jgi:DUF4097 and DUF4098 domain-containing protein YvlB
MPATFTIDIPGHAELHLTTRSGRLTVIAEERADVFAEEGASSRGPETDATGRISLGSAKGGSADLVVRCPAGTDLAVGTISGNVELRGPLGQVRITTVSGSARVERAEELDVRTISGSIDVDRCTGRCSLRSKSGHALCGSARDASVSTISGQIRLDETTGNVRAQTVSGTVEVGTQRDGDVAVQTISGSVKIEVPDGVRPDARLRSLAGRPRLDCPEGSDCRIAVRSMSGKIEVVSC